MTIEKEQLFNDTLHIETTDLFKRKNIDSYLKYRLQEKIEGKCYKNGYIVPNSLEIVQRSVGKIIGINSTNNIEYNITYKTKSIIPSVGDIFECVISSITKMGIVAYLDYNDCKIEQSPLLFIVPKEYFEELDVDKLKKEDIINIEVLDTRIKFMTKQIQVVGKPEQS